MLTMSVEMTIPSITAAQFLDISIKLVQEFHCVFTEHIYISCGSSYANKLKLLTVDC